MILRAISHAHHVLPWLPATPLLARMAAKLNYVQERVWLSSPNLMSDAGSTRSREQSGRSIRLHPYTVRQRELHLQHAHTHSSSYNSPVSHMDSHQQWSVGQEWTAGLSPCGVHYQDYTDELNKLLALTLCSHCLHSVLTLITATEPRDHSLAPSADHKKATKF